MLDYTLYIIESVLDYTLLLSVLFCALYPLLSVLDYTLYLLESMLDYTLLLSVLDYILYLLLSVLGSTLHFTLSVLDYTLYPCSKNHRTTQFAGLHITDFSPSCLGHKQ